MANELRFELETIQEKNELSVKDFETTLKNVQDFFANKPICIIANEEQKKTSKVERAELNKIIKAIDRTRIDSIEEFCGKFVDQCKQLTSLFNERQKAIGEKLTEYENSKVLQQSTISTKYKVTLTVEGQDQLKKVLDFCEKHNIKYLAKGE